jgi:hypothetical protein
MGQRQTPGAARLLSVGVIVGPGWLLLSGRPWETVGPWPTVAVFRNTRESLSPSA